MLRRRNGYKEHGSFSLKPEFIAASVIDIDFAYLKSIGITSCFLDLDGTVVERGTFEITPALKDTLKHSGLDIFIATNRPKSRSLRTLREDLSAKGVVHPIGLYGKPTKRYIRHALEEYKLKAAEVIMVGDRLIQDILGANRSGIHSLAVHKLGKSIGIFDKLLSRVEKNTLMNEEKYYSEV